MADTEEKTTELAKAKARQYDVGVRHPARKVGFVLAVIIFAVAMILFCVNVFVRASYASFYQSATPEFALSGISEGFIPQDIDYLDVPDAWLVSGYMADGSKASPVYKVASDGSVSKLDVLDADGKPYMGHGSGITSDDDFVFMTREDGYMAFQIRDFSEAQDGGQVQAIGDVDLEFTPSFLNIEQGAILAGNFYHPEAYETPAEHHIQTTDDLTNHAILYKYPTSDGEGARFGYSDQAECVYSIPDRTQGVCVTPDGRMVFSTSYGLATSKILVYKPNAEQHSEFTADGRDIPLYMLDGNTLVEQIDAPPMTEGIEWHDGKVWISDESATNKYIFGKLYGAGHVYALSL